jgi:hypothetical protein
VGFISSSTRCVDNCIYCDSALDVCGFISETTDIDVAGITTITRVWEYTQGRTGTLTFEVITFLALSVHAPSQLIMSCVTHVTLLSAMTIPMTLKSTATALKPVRPQVLHALVVNMEVGCQLMNLLWEGFWRLSPFPIMGATLELPLSNWSRR